MRTLRLVGTAATLGATLVASPPALADAAPTNRSVEPTIAGPTCMWGYGGGQRGGAIAYAWTDAPAPCDGAWVQLHYKTSGGAHRTRSMYHFASGAHAEVSETGTYLYSCHSVEADGTWDRVYKRGTAPGACGSPR
jgi:hypothetical protein